MEIESILAKHGAKYVQKEFRDNEVVALMFFAETPYGDIPIRLPVNTQQVLAVMQRQHVPRRFLNMEHASRVAWRIVKDWVQSQMALLETEMVTLTEIFLPYAVNKDGKTFYQALEEGHFKMLGQGQ
jgi:hypothetical protein